MRSRSPEADLAECARLLATGSRTFAMAARLMPTRLRDAATALYAFCRVADDAIDGNNGDAQAVTRLHARLDAIYAGHPDDNAVDRAFAHVVHRFAIPRALPEALLEGFAWDAAGRRYDDLVELQAYAARVAGSVGAMMALVMGARAPAAIARACDLGVAMQLTNIARDVGEDARNGRLYLPRAWLREVGIDPEQWLERPVHDARLATVLARLLRVADLLYQRSIDGIANLPLICRPGIHAARVLYAEIGRAVERNQWDAVTTRAVVRRSRKIVLAAAALLASVRVARPIARPTLPETQFLVAAVAAWPLAVSVERIAWWNFTARFNWMLDLFERLERREQFQRALVARRGPEW